MIVHFDAGHLIPLSLRAVAANAEGLAIRLVTELTEAAKLKWRNAAAQELHSTKGDYVRGIQEPVYQFFGDRPSSRIELVGAVPNMVEQGWDGGDLRQFLCDPAYNSKNKKPIHDPEGNVVGWYNVVPFRHGSPDSSGQTGTPMGSQYLEPGPMSRATPGVVFDLEQAKDIGQTVYGEARRLGATRSEYNPATNRHETVWGERLEEGWAPKLKPEHATDPFAGMVRMQKTYEKDTQSQYMTFRTISTQVQNGWIHPGIKARNLVEKVREHVATIAPKAALRLIRRAG